MGQLFRVRIWGIYLLLLGKSYRSSVDGFRGQIRLLDVEGGPGLS